MKRFEFLFVLILTAMSFNLNAQSLKGVPVKDRLFFGGSLGASFGQYTYVELSPVVGYRVTEKLHAGVGITYMYYNDKYWHYEESVYGGNVFARYFFMESVFGIVQGGALRGNGINEMGQIEKMTIPNLWLGVGYAQRLGGNGALMFSLLYDIIDDRNSFYQNPLIQIGFGFGF